jgi:hypothetical protein
MRRADRVDLTPWDRQLVLYLDRRCTDQPKRSQVPGTLPEGGMSGSGGTVLLAFLAAAVSRAAAAVGQAGKARSVSARQAHLGATADPGRRLRGRDVALA